MPPLRLPGSCAVGAPGPCLVSRIASFAIPLAIAVAACASNTSGPSMTVAPATPTAVASPAATLAAAPTPLATAALRASAVPGSPAVSDAPPTGLEPSAPPLGSPAPPVRIDDALAAIFPATVDGHDVQRATATEEAARSSQTLGRQADGFAAVEVSTPDVSDLAIASVLHVKAGTDAAAFFAGDWRPGFDEAGCAPAGGVASRDVETIAGRSVQTTACKEGATVYYVLRDDGTVIISVLEVGTKGYGRALIEGLTG